MPAVNPFVRILKIHRLETLSRKCALIADEVMKIVQYTPNLENKCVKFGNIAPQINAFFLILQLILGKKYDIIQYTHF